MHQGGTKPQDVQKFAKNVPNFKHSNGLLGLAMNDLASTPRPSQKGNIPSAGMLHIPGCHWRSQALNKGWTQEVWGTAIPSGVQERSPEESGGKAPRSQIYTEFAAVKCFSTRVCSSSYSFNNIAADRRSSYT